MRRNFAKLLELLLDKNQRSLGRDKYHRVISRCVKDRRSNRGLILRGLECFA